MFGFRASITKRYFGPQTERTLLGFQYEYTGGLADELGGVGGTGPVGKPGAGTAEGHGGGEEFGGEFVGPSPDLPMFHLPPNGEFCPE